MSEGLLVVSGALIGFFGSILANVVVVRRDQDAARQEALRAVTAEFSRNMVVWRLSVYRLSEQPGELQNYERSRDAYSNVRAAYEQLLLNSSDLDVQKNAREAIHCWYWAMRATREQRDQVDAWVSPGLDWTVAFTKSARRELGLRSPETVYIDPPAAYPTPDWSKD